uniref:Uncharacterized protein n=1 Tax=Callithrix jacchus TaxID=9483 RepID=A0A8I3X282_CALJA
MCNAVCIFYLVLRALDMLEDDMTISVEKKVPLLHNVHFHSFLYQPDWRFMESKEKDSQVLEDFPTISLEFRNLAEKYQTVIADICRRMGTGMAEFLNKHVTSEQEWDKSRKTMFRLENTDLKSVRKLKFTMKWIYFFSSRMDVGFYFLSFYFNP